MLHVYICMRVYAQLNVDIEMNHKIRESENNKPTNMHATRTEQSDRETIFP